MRYKFRERATDGTLAGSQAFQPEALPRHFSKFLNALRYRRPALRAVAIDMHLRVEPTCIVEAVSFDKGKVGHYGHVAGDGRFRRTGWPLSPVSLNVLSRPRMDSADFGIPTTTVKAVPACFWQFLQ
jgi:hypothetical protein